MCRFIYNLIFIVILTDSLNPYVKKHLSYVSFTTTLTDVAVTNRSVIHHIPNSCIDWLRYCCCIDVLPLESRKLH